MSLDADENPRNLDDARCRYKVTIQQQLKWASTLILFEISWLRFSSITEAMQ